MVAYYMIIDNAELLVQRLVAYETKGKFKVTIGKIRFHPFQRRIDLVDITLESDHLSADATAFAFSGDKVSLQLSHIRPLIFRKQLLVDSILFESPHVKILREPVKRGWGTNSTRKLTLHEVLGDVYVKMQNLFKVLYVKRGEINNGELVLADNGDPLHPILTLKGMYFLLERMNVNKANQGANDPFMFSQNISFRTGPESIDLPDGLHHLSFSQLTLNTFKKFIEIDDCRIQGTSKENTQNRFDIFSKKLKLVNLDFAALYSGDIIKADSVYCLEPNLSLELGHGTNLNLQPKKKAYTYDSLQQIVKMVTGNLAVNYLGIVNADINTFIAIKNKVNSFSTKDASFEVYDLNVNTESGMPATVSHVDFAIRGYHGFSPDSLYIIKFDSIRLLSDRLVLWNAGLSLAKNVSKSDFKELHVDKFELTDIDWLDFLKNRRVTAKRAFLAGAQVKIFVDKRKKGKVQGSMIDAIHSVNPSINVEDLIISNATIDYEVKDRFMLSFQNASVEVSVRELIASDSIDNLHRSLRRLIADKGQFKSKRITASLEGVNYFRRDSTLLIQKVQLHHEKGIDLNAENFLVKGFKKSGNEIFVNALGWKKAIVNVHPAASSSPAEQDRPKRKFQLGIGMLDFANTAFSFEKKDQKIDVLINYIRAKTVSRREDITVNELQVSGDHISFQSGKQKLQTGAFLLGNNVASWIRALNLTQNGKGSEMSISMAELKFKPDINQVLKKKYAINDVVLESPSVKLTSSNQLKDSLNKKSPSDLPKFEINSISLVKPSIIVENTGEKKMHLELEGNEVVVRNFRTSARKLEIGTTTSTLNRVDYSNGTGIKLQTEKGRAEIVIDAGHYNIDKDTMQSRWQTTIGKISLSNIVYEKSRNDSLLLKANLPSFELDDFVARDKNIGNFAQLVRDNPKFHLHNVTAIVNAPTTNLYCRNLGYKEKNLTLDSLAVIPVLSWEEFNSESAFQRDYIRVRSKNIRANGFDLLRFATEKKLSIEHLSIAEPILNVSKDKRLVFKTGIIKPLPAKMLAKINVPLFIDTVNIADGYISYTETSEKTNKTGVISFNNLNAWIHPLKNFDFQPTDSLRLRADAYMLDSMLVSLRIRESYVDSLAGFWMTVVIKPVEIPVLNPVLEPLASVQVGSGKLDHLEMRAVGREYISFGEMKFFYHDLKIKILKNGELEKRSFLTSMATFVANNFVIRTNNTSRDGRVFFLRNRERSIFNYWLKMTLSGVASSAGAKSNRKMMKKYKDEIKKRQLPPINLD